MMQFSQLLQFSPLRLAIVMPRVQLHTTFEKYMQKIRPVAFMQELDVGRKALEISGLEE